MSDAAFLKDFVNNIEGWLSEREAELLYNLAKNCSGQGVIVEIGSWKGKSTVCLARGSKDGKEVKVYAIDPHTGSLEHQRKMGRVWTFEEFEQNIKKAAVDSVVVPLVKASEEAVRNFNRPIEILFIDGNHEYRAVKLDFELWFPKVIEGGIIAFHDTIGFDGPKRVSRDFMLKSFFFKRAKIVDSITFAKKTSKNTVIDRIRNNYILGLRSFSEFANSLANKLKIPVCVRRIYKKIILSLQ